MLLNDTQTLAAGRSFWRVVLSTGRTYSELDMVEETRDIPFSDEKAWEEFKQRKRMRRLDWYLDIVATGDVERIVAIMLHTPVRGATPHVALKITEPRTAWILNTNILNNITGNDTVAQTIGRVEDKATGTGTAFTWDAAIGQMFKDESACVHNLAAWRPGICNPGVLSIAAMGLSL